MIRAFRISLLVLCIAASAVGQRLAVLSPYKEESSKAAAAKIEKELAPKLKIIDNGIAASAFDAAALKTPFNLTTDEAKQVGQAIGCEFFLLVRSALPRRSSFERQEYYEAYATIFLVSARTGRLVSFFNESHTAEKPRIASAALDAALPDLGGRIGSAVKQSQSAALIEADAVSMDQPPDPDSPAAKGFRAPVPFKRLKPEYTDEASLYDITATVEVLVDLSANGKVLRTEVTRWAGYGLDESAVAAIRSMNWRPAERDGKFLPVRFLVRYNFKKAGPEPKSAASQSLQKLTLTHP